MYLLSQKLSGHCDLLNQSPTDRQPGQQRNRLNLRISNIFL